MTTREKILKSAYVLFAKDGFESVSVREITKHAKVNLASVNYHFGGKSGLIQDVVTQVIIPLNKQRVILLKKAGDELGGIERVEIRATIEAFIRPLVYPEEHGGSADMIAQLMACYLTKKNSDVSLAVMDSFGDVYKIFSVVINAQCPDIEPEQALKNLFFSSGAIFMYQSFSGFAAKATGDENDLNIDDNLERVLRFCEAGFKAK